MLALLSRRNRPALTLFIDRGDDHAKHRWSAGYQRPCVALQSSAADDCSLGIIFPLIPCYAHRHRPQQRHSLSHMADHEQLAIRQFDVQSLAFRRHRDISPI